MIGRSLSPHRPARPPARDNGGVIQHDALEVREQDVPACVDFWTLPGFLRGSPPAALSARAAGPQAGPPQIHLLFAEDPVIAQGGTVEIAVKNPALAYARLVAAGFEPQQRG